MEDWYSFAPCITSLLSFYDYANCKNKNFEHEPLGECVTDVICDLSITEETHSNKESTCFISAE